jgi:hypothetical protein
LSVQIISSLGWLASSSPQNLPRWKLPKYPFLFNQQEAEISPLPILQMHGLCVIVCIRKKATIGTPEVDIRVK